MPDAVASPWDGIAVPNADFNVRQLPGRMAVPCYWGRDVNGSCLFVMELRGDHTAQFRENITPINGIDVDLRAGIAGHQRLILTLGKQADRDLFEGLCRTLAIALSHASDSVSSLSIALAHLHRWRAFLSGRGSKHLSAEEVRGLFAELVFLRELLERKPSMKQAVDAWLGPERSHQDFIFENTAVEVKSLSGTERSAVRISSEDQLESLNDNLFLRIYRLSALPDAPQALSLNQIVTIIREHVADADALEAFDRKLVAHGYAPLSEYDEPRFAVSEMRSFKIEAGFPCLIRSTVPAGIAKVSYDIQLEVMTPYECDGKAVFGEG